MAESDEPVDTSPLAEPADEPAGPRELPHPGTPLPAEPTDDGILVPSEPAERPRGDAAAGEDIYFDPDGVDQAIAEIDELPSELQDHRWQAEPLTEIAPRGDWVSDHYANRANDGGRKYLDFVDRQVQYLTSLIERMEDVKRERQQYEDEAADSLRGKG